MGTITGPECFVASDLELFPPLGQDSAADTATGSGEGARNMKSMQPPSVAIFFVTYFYRVGGHVSLAVHLDTLL